MVYLPFYLGCRESISLYKQFSKFIVRYNKPLEYAQLVLGGEIEHYLSLGCDHGRMEVLTKAMAAAQNNVSQPLPAFIIP